MHPRLPKNSEAFLGNPTGQNQNPEGFGGSI
jgi:hypothetical protein